MRKFLLFAVCIGIWSGCGADRGLVPVKGRVTLDGQPIEGAAVMFEPDSGGVPATGVTNSAGEFLLTTTGLGAGATAGKNGVSVSKQVPAQPNRKVEEGEIVAMKSETPAKYASPRTSGLSIEVKHGMEPVELQLTSNK
jgi:hypothetical protein